MKILLAGGSGQVGTILSRAFRQSGAEVIVLSRESKMGRVQWDGHTPGTWTRELEGADVVINLAGRSVNCRYGPASRRAIMESRVASTRVIGRAIKQARRPPRLWLQASTATIYAHRYDAANDEVNGILGGEEPNAPDTWRFSIEVAKAWERAVSDVGVLPRTRIVLMRSAIILSPDKGGIFDTLLGLVRHGLGGRAGDGGQFISWIHEHDFVRAVRWLIEREHLNGVVNLASPEPLPNAEFMCVLREAHGARFGLPASKWMLEIGAFFLRTETELILKSRRVAPGRLRRDGFEFAFSHWREAAQELCARWKRING